jgi:hypothetical protein
VWTNTGDSERCIYFLRLVDDVTCKYVLFVVYENKLFSSHFGAAGMALEKGEPS